MNTRRVASVVMACVLLGACSSTSSSGAGPVTTSAAVTSTSAAATTPAATTSATVTTAPATTAPTSAKATTTATSDCHGAATTAAGAWTLGINGLGPLVLGTKFSVLEAQGYVSAPNDECESSRTSQKLQDEGVWLYPKGSGATAVLAEVGVTKATYATVSGAKVGDTMKKLKQIYGAQLKIETKNGNGGPFQVANVHIGTREVVFMLPVRDEPGRHLRQCSR